MFSQYLRIFNIILIISLMTSSESKTVEEIPEHIKLDEPPEGVYAFMESKDTEPPTVRPPPYKYVKEKCIDDPNPIKSTNNFCGNLNTGKIPINPMNPEDPYPFKEIRDQFLEKIEKALPILKNDDLPRVKEVINDDLSSSSQLINDDIQNELKRRNDELPESYGGPQPHINPNENRKGKGCEGGGVLCYLTNMFQGNSNGGNSNSGNVLHRKDEYHPPSSISAMTRFGEGPPTPCPAKIHYATPSYAKNYQGIWRYIVQIPYEGYYTQVVEVTYCLYKRSYHLEGYCLSTPRWERLLAAEKYYPNNNNSSSISQVPNNNNSTECHGYDSHGCYQIRIFQDWFSVPSSCKVWRPDFYKRHAYQRN